MRSKNAIKTATLCHFLAGPELPTSVKARSLSHSKISRSDVTAMQPSRPKVKWHEAPPKTATLSDKVVHHLDLESSTGSPRHTWRAAARVTGPQPTRSRPEFPGFEVIGRRCLAQDGAVHALLLTIILWNQTEKSLIRHGQQVAARPPGINSVLHGILWSGTPPRLWLSR